jgi:hypothetical protein
VIHSLIGASDFTEIQALLKSHAHDLYPLLPEVVSQVTSETITQPLISLEPEQEKRRIFTALVHCFSSLASRQPLVLV